MGVGRLGDEISLGMDDIVIQPYPLEEINHAAKDAGEGKILKPALVVDRL